MRSHFSEHELLQRGIHECVRLRETASETCEEEANGFVVELANEHELAENFKDNVVSSHAHRTSWHCWLVRALGLSVILTRKGEANCVLILLSLINDSIKQMA